MLVAGARDLISSAVAAALRDAGYAVVAAVRAGGHVGNGDMRESLVCDFARDVDPSDRAVWRRWLGLGPARIAVVPRSLALANVWFAERFGRGPMGMTMWRMLERGHLTGPGAHERVAEALAITLRTLDAVLTNDAIPSAAC